MLPLVIGLSVLVIVSCFQFPNLNLNRSLRQSTIILAKRVPRIVLDESEVMALYNEMDMEYEERKKAWEAAYVENMKLKKPKNIKPLKPAFEDLYEYLKFKEKQSQSPEEKEKQSQSPEDKAEKKRLREEEKRKRQEQELKNREWSDSRNFIFKHSRYIPIIDTPTWFVVDVTERKVDQVIAQVQQPPFNGSVFGWYATPPKRELGFSKRGKNGTLVYKNVYSPRISRRDVPTEPVYLKTIMNPVVLETLKGIDGVYAIPRTGENKLVLPCPPKMQAQLDAAFSTPPPPVKEEISEEMQKLRVGDYVLMQCGPYAGENGVILGATDGHLRVERKRDKTTILVNPRHVIQQEDPMDEETKTTSMREMAQKLLDKNPTGREIKHLASQGILTKVLLGTHAYLDDRIAIPKQKKRSRQQAAPDVSMIPKTMEDARPWLRRTDENGVQLPRMPHVKQFKNIGDFKQALLDYDKQMYLINEAKKLDTSDVK